MRYISISIAMFAVLLLGSSNAMAQGNPLEALLSGGNDPAPQAAQPTQQGGKVKHGGGGPAKPAGLTKEDIISLIQETVKAEKEKDDSSMKDIEKFFVENFGFLIFLLIFGAGIGIANLFIAYRRRKEYTLLVEANAALTTRIETLERGAPPAGTTP